MPVKRAGKLNGIEARLENAQKRALIESGMLVAQRAQNKAPIDKGRLKRSITYGIPYRAGQGQLAEDVGTNVEYAAAQELGSGLYGPKRQKYLITAKRAKVLAFEWLGKMRFFRYVWHPGVKPKPYLRPALDESKPQIIELHIKNILAAFKKK